MNTPLHPSRRIHAALAFLLLAGAAGCGLGGTVSGLGRSAGNGLVTGVRGQLDSASTPAAIRQLTGTATSSLAAGISGSVRPAIDTTLSGVFGRTRTFLNGTQDSLALYLAGPLNASLQSLIRGNVQTLDAQLQPLITATGAGLREQLALTISQAGTGVQQSLIPLVGAAVDSASARLAANASGPLRQAIDSIVSSAVRSGVDAAEQSSRPLFNRISGALMGVAGVLVLGALLWMRADRRKNQRALFAMAEAIRNTDDEQVRESIKDRIKANARRHGIDGHLHSFLEKHELLRGSERPDRIHVPKLVRHDEAAAAAGPRPPG